MATRRPAMRLLAIDGDEVLLALLRLALGGDGVEITTVSGGSSGLASAEQYEPDLIVLDTVLPDLSGYEVLRRLRERTDVPVIVLSGRDGHVDKVRAFELGADDYVTKPFSLPELEARVHAQLRRARRWMRREGVRRAYAYAA
jgi:DNA-binding response OmpR family regulator